MEAVTLDSITVLIGFLALLGSQIGGMFIMLDRMNDQNKRIDDLNRDMNRRFDTMNSEMNRRFENVDKRLDTVNSEMNRRFDTMNQRFDETTLLIGELRDRTGKLEGTLEGFLAGQRDRDAA